MRVVVDASVVIGMLLAGGRRGPLTGYDLVAPPLLRSEATAVMSEMAWRREIPPDRAREALAALPALDITFEGPAELYERAWEIALRAGWARTYDAEYVALSLMLDAPLVTLDARLVRDAGHLAPVALPDALRRDDQPA
jgi:predicted nucleic acid-binding protein